jgi:hypothetical protein
MARQCQTGLSASALRRRTWPTPFIAAVRGWLFASVALLGVSSQLCVQMHMLLVPHSTCPEHGELVHGVDNFAPVSARFDASERVPALHAGRHSPLAVDSHCDVVGHRRECLNVAVCEAPRGPLFALNPDPPAYQAPLRASGQERYTLAPKNSPPRA